MMASDMSTTTQSSENTKESVQDGGNGVDPSSSANQVPNSDSINGAVADGDTENSPKAKVIDSPIIVKQSAMRTESDTDGTSQTRLSNGISNHDVVGVSVDEQISMGENLESSSVETLPAVDDHEKLSQNSDGLLPTPIGSPQLKNPTHQREDSGSSMTTEVLAVEDSTPRIYPLESTSSILLSTHSSRLVARGGGAVLEGDPKSNLRGGDIISDDPVPTERAVGYSPDGRFLKYDIEIGRGSFKTVYKGLDTETGVAIAWCELQEKRYNKVEQARFKEEVAILKTLQHPNILKLYDSWESAGHRPEKKDKVLILVTELMTSGTLKSYMRRLKSIKPKVFRSWGRQILRGLHFLHTRLPPIIHRDLKCDNIFINGTTGLVKIGDLGLATLKRSDVTTVIGTPEFMAPEMYEESYDESVDVYAFGMCLLEMCTQEYPYMECSNPAQIYKRVSQGIKPHAIDKIKDATLRDIIERCTTVDKAHRFNVQDLLNHEFFAENIKMDIVPVPEPTETQSSTPTTLLTMRMDVPKQDTSKKNGQESIEFPYDLKEDVPDDVVREMVKSGILHSSVQHMVSRSLREYIEGVKQKRHPGRIVDEGKEKGGEKTLEPKTNPPSHTPSPSPAGANEPTPVDNELVPPKVQSQLSVDETTSSVKPDDGAGPKSETQPGGTVQGQDMTGQGAMPTGTIERDRTLSLNMSKVQEPKQPDLVSPTLHPNLPLPDHPLSTVQQITASTGQAIPQDSGLKSQSSSTLSDKKSYASVTKKPPSQNGADSHSNANLSSAQPQLGTGSSAEKHIPEASPPSQDLKPPSVRSENLLSTPSHDIQSDTSAESTPVHQSHSDTEYSSTSGQPNEKDKTAANGTLKRKAQRGKPKPIRLTLLESNSDNKVIKCQLVTSNGKILKYQFSLKYDKPEEMFLKFVKAGHLTDQDKDEFLQQSNLVIRSVKVKGKESKTDPSESKTDSSESKLPNLGIQDSSKPRQDPLSTIVTSPTETPPISDTQGSAKEGPESSQSSSQSDARSSKSVHFNEGISKPDMFKPAIVSQTGLQEVQHSEPAVKTSLSSVNEEGSTQTKISKEVSVPGSLSSSSTSSLGAVGSSQPSVDNISALVTHTTFSQVPPTPPSPTHTPSVESSVQIIPQPLHTLTIGAPFDNLSSCSLPQLNAQCTPSTPLGPAAQYGSTGNVFTPTTVPTTTMVTPQTAPSSQRVKIFEVESVVEDHPDSPETSDMSAHGSTENLGGETSYPQKTEKQELNPPQKSSAVPPPKKFIVQSVSSGSLESKSDSYIGKESISVPFTSTTSQDTPVHFSSNVRYPSHSHGVPAPPPAVTVPPTYKQPPYQQHSDESGLRTTTRHHSQPYILPQGVNAQEYVPAHPSNRIPEHHYSTTSLLDYYTNSQRIGITDETYVHPRYRRNQSYNVLSTLPAMSEPEVSDVHYQEMVHPPASSLDHTPTIDDLPHANLLSEAFMRFMHSMSVVFRDPTFNPLINSLDQKFGSQPAPSHFPYPSTEPASAPPVFSGVPREETVLRSTTDPVHPVAYSNDDAKELRVALEKIEEEQRKLEKRKQQMIQDFHRRKHSSGNSSLESSSGLPESRKISATSYDTVSLQSPTQTRRSVKLSEYEEGGADQSSSPWPTQRGGVSTDKFIEMERRVKDGLTADKLRSETSSPSHAGLSVVAEQHETSRGVLRTSQHVPTSTGTQTLTNTSHPTAKSAPTNMSHPDHSGSLSPHLQTSPPPQTVGVSTFQMQTSPSTTLRHSGSFGSRPQHSSQPKSQKPIRNYQPQQSTQTSLPHSDSNEWTEYTSALPMTAAPSVVSYSHGFEGRTGSVYDAPSSGSVAASIGSRGTSSVLSNTHGMTTLSSVGFPGAAVTTDVSEFDPIASQSNASVQSSTPKS